MRELVTDVGDGKWHHMAGTYDGKMLSIYVDGACEDLVTGLRGSIRADNQPVHLGEDSPGPTYTWGGLIDDVRTYSHVLNSEEVKMLHEGKGLPREKNGE